MDLAICEISVGATSQYIDWNVVDNNRFLKRVVADVVNDKVRNAFVAVMENLPIHGFTLAVRALMQINYIIFNPLLATPLSLSKPKIHC